MKVTRGSRFDYLGMKVEINSKKVKIEMKDQILEAIEWYKSNRDGKIMSPSTSVAKHLFVSSDDAEALDNRQKQIFHLTVTKLLYVSK